jgi:2-oxoglutarate dehydrogenase E2 component (dihydrolipoamide succinyltransferase)
MSATIEIRVPAEQEGTKAIVRSWLVKVGDWVELDGPLVELETDKVTQEVPSPAAGVLTEIILDSDDEAEPGAILGRMTLAAAREEVANGPGHGHALIPVTGLSPAVRRAIKEHAIDPATVAGTGRGGRITRADVDKAIAERAASPAAPSDAGPATPTADRVTTVPHDRMRLAIAQNMLHSVTVAPHVTAVFECDFSAVIAHRNKHKTGFERDGVKLTFTAYVLAASAEAMKAAPAVNSRWHDDRLEIFEDIDIGVGTAIGEKGLIVPLVRRVQDLSLQGIAKRLSELTVRARKGKLSGADVAGGTFTVSNHGVSGSLVAAPIIINQPQSAILGVGKLEKRVVVREVGGVETIQIRPMCYISLTIDHRALDGYQTNAWLTKFVATIENWPET